MTPVLGEHQRWDDAAVPAILEERQEADVRETAMARRSRAREVALQLLFQRDFNPGVERSVIERFVHDRLRDTSLEPFCLGLFDGTAAKTGEIDPRLAAAAEHWRVARMPAVDRNVLRLGAFELLFTPDTPANVVLNESIELVRRYGSADSPAFVNGVLDQLRKAAAPSA
jgi:N utilization substance protein B